MDFGALRGLSGVSNWDAIRQGKAQELQFAILQNAMAEREAQAEQQSAQRIQQYQDIAGNLKVMNPDMTRIKERNKALLEPINEGLRKHHGNVQEWLKSGGELELNRYRNNLINSPEVQQGLMNTAQHQMYLADQQEGKVPLDIQWETPDGPRRGRYEEQFAEYKSGKTPSLVYRGGYKRPDVNPEKYFSEMPPPAGSDPYQPNPVDVPTLQRYLKLNTKGSLNDEESEHFANDYTSKYAQSVQRGASPYMYQQLDPDKKRLMDTQIQKNLLQISKESGASGNDKANFLVNWHDNKIPAEEKGRKQIGNSIVNEWGTSYDMATSLSNVLGLNVDNKGEVVNKNALKSTPLMIGDMNLDLSGLTPTMIKSASPSGKLSKITTKDASGKLNQIDAVKFTITINEEGAEAALVNGKPIEWSMFGGGGTPVPGAQEEGSGPFDFLRTNGHDVTMDVYYPFTLSPQLLQEFVRQNDQKPGTSGGNFVPESFEYSASTALQDNLDTKYGSTLNELIRK